MSIQNPLFGLDVHPGYQRGFDFDQADALGYKFAFVKVSEGPYRDGTTWNHPGLESFVRRAKDSGMLVGYYHFLVESDAKDPGRGGRIQAELFWRRVRMLGGAKGRLLCVDFEEYAKPHAYLTPSNATLKAFNRRLNELSGGHPLILYAAPGFWTGGEEPSGAFGQYGADVLWKAQYPSMDILEKPRDAYDRLKKWDEAWDGFGGEEPEFWQFTAAGTVAGRNIDVNAYRRNINHLRSLAVMPLPNEDEDEEPKPRPPRPAPKDPKPENRLMENVRRVKDYGLDLLEHHPRYWCWDGGNLDVARPSVGRPAANDGPAPRPGGFRRMFCADLIAFQLRLLGKPIPKNRFGNENYDGGTRSFRLRYGKQMKPFKLSECREGDVAFVDFQTRWAPEGHIGFCLGDGPDAKFLQSHLNSVCTVGEPGLNRDWTVAQSHDGGYYTHRIPREVLWS